MTSFMPAWQAIRDGIKGFKLSVNSTEVPVADGFFNAQPELRNPEDKARFPGMVLRTQAPFPGDLVVNEPMRVVVTVTAEPCWLEAVVETPVALVDGQTLQVRVGTEVVGPPRDTAFVTQSVVFHSADFANIAVATPAEVAAVLSAQLSGVSVEVRPDGVTLRITQSVLGAWSSLQITGGTATALRALFPTRDVWGREAGEELQLFDPPDFLHFPFQVTTKSTRPDHHAMLGAIVNRIFKIRGSPNQRGITVAGSLFSVTWEGVSDDPVAPEGTFFTTNSFLLRNVPLLDPYSTPVWNGGNPSTSGGSGDPVQLPIIEFFELRVAPVSPQEPLLGLPASAFEVVVVPVS